MPLSIFQIPLQKPFLQAEFHPRNDSIIILYSNGDLQSISPEGKENWILSFDCEPVAFRINAAGDLIAILGKGRLFFYNLLTLTSSKFDVDEKFQLLEFYKNSVLLSGFQNNIVLMRQNGSVNKNLEFDSLIRQFKPVPSTENLIIYNQDRKLLCSDMDGNILWQIENLIIYKEIIISQKGHLGYFILNPNDLLQFNVYGESFFEVCDERTIKSFSVSWDGNILLFLDVQNELVMLDKTAQKLWEYRLEHDISQVRLSPKGDFFLTVDDDDVLSFYSIGSTDKNREDFFEITDEKRILGKELIWTIRPGGYNAVASLSELKVSPDRDLFGIVGRDGCIYFYNESGKIYYQTSFTSTVKQIGIHNSQYGYIYGGNEVTIVDFKNDKKKYILFEKTIVGEPIVNYHHQKIFTVSREKELLIYNFQGHLINTIPLKDEYRKGINCEACGIILINKHKITGFSESGEIFFNYPVDSEINYITYHDPLLIWLLNDHSVIKIDLSSLKGKRTALNVKEGDSRIVTADPLLIVTGEKRLYHLDLNLSLISTFQVESMDSHFYLDNGTLYEIIKNYSGFFCYNDIKEMIWRYSQEERIVESALMNNGLVFYTEDSVSYFDVRKKEESKKDFSEYLEI